MSSILAVASIVLLAAALAQEQEQSESSPTATVPVEPRLDPPYAVRGRLVATNGEPITTGTVCGLLDLRVDQWGYYTFSNSTRAMPVGADGGFDIVLPRAPAILLAESPGMQFAVSGVIDPGAGGLGAIEIVLREGQRVRGIVQDQEGSGVEGANITVFVHPTKPASPNVDYAPPRLGRRAVSAEAGAFVLDGVSGTLELTEVRHPDHVHFYQSVDYVVGAGAPLLITLEKAQRLAGVFVTKGDAKPSFRGGYLRSQVVVDEYWETKLAIGADGRFDSGALPYKASSAILLLDGFLPRNLDWTNGTGVRDVGAVEVDPGSSLAVRVVSAAGEPIAGASVFLRGRQPMPGMERVPLPGQEGKADESGRWHATGLFDMPYALEAAAEGYAHFGKVVAPSGEAAKQELNVVLQRPAVAKLALVDSARGMPIAGTPVKFEFTPSGMSAPYRELRSEGGSTTTDQDGRAALPVPYLETELRLDLTISGFGLHTTELAPFTAESTRDLGEIGIRTGGVVRGRVVDQDGNGVSTSVSLEWEEFGPGRRDYSAGVESERTDVHGRFQVTNLKLRDYVVTVDTYRHAQPLPRRISLTEKNPVFEGLDFVLEPGRAYEGTITLADGTPAFDVQMDLRRQGDSAQRWALVGIAEDGRFKTACAPPGPVRLSVTTGVFTKHMLLDIRKDSCEALPSRIVLPPIPIIEIFVAVKGPKQLPEAIDIELRRELPSGGESSRGIGSNKLRNGSARLLAVDPGNYSVGIEARGFPAPPSQEIVVDEGQKATVSFLLDGGDSGLLVQVFDPTGKPVVGATVHLKQTFVIKKRFWFDSKSMRQKSVGTTTSDGGLRVFLPADGELAIVVEAEGYAAHEHSFDEIPAPGATLRIELEEE